MFDWITTFIREGSYFAIALLMLVENIFPPIPSELIMPLAGYVASQGQLSLVGVFIAGWIGSVAGALFWYYIGVWYGLDRLCRFAANHGRWLTLSPQDVDKSNEWFRRHGGMAVFFGRLVPGVRTFISVPAGVSDMGFGVFFIYTSIGTGLWTALLIAAGYLLGSSYGDVSSWLSPVTDVVLVAMAAIYIYRVATFKRHLRRQQQEGAE